VPVPLDASEAIPEKDEFSVGHRTDWFREAR